MKIDNLTTEQQCQLLDFFAYNLSMDLRYRLMCELPMAYNAWCGHEVVRVLRVSDLTHMEVPLNKCEIQRNQKPFHFQGYTP
jgi:hypothetical protein